MFSRAPPMPILGRASDATLPRITCCGGYINISARDFPPKEKPRRATDLCRNPIDYPRAGRCRRRYIGSIAGGVGYEWDMNPMCFEIVY